MHAPQTRGGGGDNLPDTMRMQFSGAGSTAYAYVNASAYAFLYKTFKIVSSGFSTTRLYEGDTSNFIIPTIGQSYNVDDYQNSDNQIRITGESNSTTPYYGAKIVVEFNK